MACLNSPFETCDIEPRWHERSGPWDVSLSTGDWKIKCVSPCAKTGVSACHSLRGVTAVLRALPAAFWLKASSSRIRCNTVAPKALKHLGVRAGETRVITERPRDTWGDTGKRGCRIHHQGPSTAAPRGRHCSYTLAGRRKAEPTSLVSRYLRGLHQESYQPPARRPPLAPKHFSAF